MKVLVEVCNQVSQQRKMKTRTGKSSIYCSLNVLSELLNRFLLYYVMDVEVIFLMNLEYFHRTKMLFRLSVHSLIFEHMSIGNSTLYSLQTVTVCFHISIRTAPRAIADSCLLDKINV